MTIPETTASPEHERLSAIQEKSQAAWEFLAWLLEAKELTLCELHTRCGGMIDQYLPAGITTDLQRLLAEFFEVDPGALEAEKREMLRQIREVPS